MVGFQNKNMKIKKIFDGSLIINDQDHALSFYLATIDEELFEFRLKKMARGILWSGDIMVIINTLEEELSRLGANDNLQIARDWLNGE